MLLSKFIRQTLKTSSNESSALMLTDSGNASCFGTPYFCTVIVCSSQNKTVGCDRLVLLVVSLGFNTAYQARSRYLVGMGILVRMESAAAGFVSSRVSAWDKSAPEPVHDVNNKAVKMNNPDNKENSLCNSLLWCITLQLKINENGSDWSFDSFAFKLM